MKISKVVILGAGAPFRGDEPAALTKIPGHQRVLDWLLNAFSAAAPDEVHFVGGFKIQSVINEYPSIRFSYNPQWETTGSLGSLLLAPVHDADSVYVSYADIVFRPSVVKKLQAEQGDVVVVVDKKWRNRYEERTEEDLLLAEKTITQNGSLADIGQAIAPDAANGEFIGLLKLSKAAVHALKIGLSSDEPDFQKGSLPTVISFLQNAGMIVRVLEIEGRWAELNAPQDLARFLLGNKAATLRRLRPLVKKSVIGEQISFTAGDWELNGKEVLQKIQDKFGSTLLAVRSSAVAEDNWTVSAAGKFTSLLNVPSEDLSRLKMAICQVIGSYEDNDPRNHVLVQEMVKTVKMSGVLFTRTLTHGAPYYVVNYDDVSTFTDTVTSGTGPHLKTFVALKTKYKGAFSPSPEVNAVIAAAEELESLVGYDSLDIEFAVDVDGRINILQLRPIAVEHSVDTSSENAIQESVQQSVELFQRRQQPSPFIKGERAIFGVMTDWNPAEIIGTRPGYLATSLYRYLILDDVWAVHRAAFGYRDVRPSPLLTCFAGHPYIDVRVSFNSFVPADIPDDLAEKLINSYLSQLVANPHLHDKVEFDILFTCMTFDFDAEVERRLTSAGFDQEEVDCLRRALLNLTVKAFDRIEGDLNMVSRLVERQEAVLSSGLPPLEKGFLLLEDCKRFGTLPFSHLARHGFVAVQLLRSLEKKGLVCKGFATDFVRSLNTVTREFESDGAKVDSGSMCMKEFVSKYGHLRPGTYSITSEKYADNHDKYLLPMLRQKSDDFASREGLRGGLVEDRNEIGKCLDDIGFSVGIDGFFDYVSCAIEGREKSKFIFTKSLSSALDCFVAFGENLGLTREQLAHLSVHDFWDIRSGMAGSDLRTFLLLRVESNMRNHQVAKAVELPPLIIEEQDFFGFHLPKSHPNFVTSHSVVSETSRVDTHGTDLDLKSKIVLVPQADPGFDWLFGYDIGGLVTMYGGANSHMTIRAAELGLPAAIGVGEKLFEELCRAEVISLDCEKRVVRVVR